MNISERYRNLFTEVLQFSRELTAADQSERLQGLLEKASSQLGEYGEQVGEIPRIQLESKLTPVLLKCHSHLDRARLLLEEEGEADRAARVWEIEQKIYRLLNDL